MTAYYNEFDPKAAAWLRELIKRGLIADGEVDNRSIVDVEPSDLKGFTQCHFFAGIGVWSHALRSARWADDRPVWTGSCPCQPFSSAGKGKADEDDRHLAPVWLRLISECRPPTVFGEQVGAAIRVGWLDHVFTALEQSEYACGAVDFPACSVGAPHIRQRLYFVADAELSGTARQREHCGAPKDGTKDVSSIAGGGSVGILGNAALRGFGISGHEAQQGSGRHTDGTEQPEFMGNAKQSGSQRQQRPGNVELHRGPGADGSTPAASVPHATNGFWADAEWIACRDGKSRPTQPGVAPLAHGASNRVVKLRGYGNAIVAPQAQAFIEAYLAR